MDFLFADKPAGVTTHTSLNESDRARILTERNDGYLEWLTQRIGQKLWSAHRLDKETTGALIFTRSPEATDKLRSLFENREVIKSYLFITDRKLEGATDFIRESFIERRGSEHVSDQTQPANSKTSFRLLDESHGFALWEAVPETGKAHQIRLHAQDADIPILGDEQHGGSHFPALCLHSHRIAFQSPQGRVSFEAPLPRFFLRRELLLDPMLCTWIAACERRERIIRTLQSAGHSTDQGCNSNEQTWRWIHNEGDPLRAEKLGSEVVVSWFSDIEPRDFEWEPIQTLAREMNWSRWHLQVRSNRGRDPLHSPIKPGGGELPSRWTAKEGDLNFEFRTDSGLSSGLFLDQRRNRLWVKQNAKGQSVLNLFCYTGGFSVAAAQGEAAKVVSVDLSKGFLEWAKRNFELNRLPIELYEFRYIDSREYLAWAKKKALSFDLVICDPPSFSRPSGNSKSGFFRIEKDFDTLLKSLMDVTSRGGKILFSCNYESWSIEEFEKRALEVCRERREFKLLPAPTPDWDFELPHAETRNMKSFILQRSAD